MTDWVKECELAKLHVDWLIQFGLKETMAITHCDYPIKIKNGLIQIMNGMDGMNVAPNQMLKKL